MLRLVARCSCSKLQLESQPSRFVVLPSSHCSEPSTVPLPQTIFWQVGPQVVPLGGSHVSGATTQPSPHVLALQTLLTQMFAPPHDAHAASTVPVSHFWPLSPAGVPVGPVTTVHFSGLALQRAEPGHESGDVVHENVQSGLQPEPATLFAVPQSHCSPVSILPLPQLAVWHTPFMHLPPFMQAVPLAGGVPVSHFWPGEPLMVMAVHVLVPAQRSAVVQELGESVHENVQLASHPVPGPLPAPKSHCSPDSTIPSPHWAETHTPPLHTLPAAASATPPSTLPPHMVPLASGVPAAQVCVVSLHVPWPAHGSLGAQFLVGSVDTQTKVQVALHPSPDVPFLLPSSHSSGEVTKPSPQTAGLHVMLRQIMPVPHEVPSAGGAPVMHVWFAVHVAVPVHGLLLLHDVPPSLEQTQLQSLVHGSPAVPFLDPSSHCSGASCTPLPHMALVESCVISASEEVASPPPSSAGGVTLFEPPPPQPVNEAKTTPPDTTAETASQRARRMGALPLRAD